MAVISSGLSVAVKQHPEPQSGVKGLLSPHSIDLTAQYSSSQPDPSAPRVHWELKSGRGREGRKSSALFEPGVARSQAHRPVCSPHCFDCSEWGVNRAEGGFPQPGRGAAEALNTCQVYSDILTLFHEGKIDRGKPRRRRRG
ncbi:hypothetical protein MHYP_G00067430 [Metynnis hypsauchen]